MLTPSGPMAVDDLPNRIASFVSAGVPVNDSKWNCRMSCFWTYRRSDVLVAVCIDGRIYWQ